MNCLCRPSRIMSVRINLLDETEFIHEIKDDLPGQALLDVVFARLNLVETSYFGIRYIDEENQTHWLDPASRISRQLKPKSDPYDLYFGVKFYAADPCKLLEEITRYQLFLQVKQDVLQGRLPVAFELAAELGAFVVQSELGDYDQRRHSKGYVSEFRLLPNQSSELETRVAELHQQLKGLSPASAELNYLDKVKWHDMYGVDLHPVLGEDSVEYFLGLTPSGIVVLRNKTTVAHYYWPRIAKVYYKGRYFMLRISDKNNELSTYGFETPRKSACKHLWRCCVEHHAFFRQVRVAPLPNSQSNTSDLFQLGSRFRYSCRSEKPVSSDALTKDALAAGRTPPTFVRVPSKRQPRRVIDDFFNGIGGGGGNPGAGTGGKNVGNNINIGGGTLLGKTSAGLQPHAMTTNYDSPYRSTYSIPTSLGVRPYHQPQHANGSSNGYNNNNGGSEGSAGGSNLQTPDSPRSTRSAPWPRSQQRSLFGHNPSSPRSVRSASTTGGGLHNHHHHHHHHHHQHQHREHRDQQPQNQHQQHQQRQPQQRASSSSASHQQRYRSSSVESHSSNDSRSTRRHKHRHRRTSDNESELSRGSGRSGRSHHRKHRRSHRHRRDSASGGGGGSDRDSTRGRSYSGHRSSSMRSGGSAELIDSTSQWREVQRRQAEASLGQSSVQQASVSKSSMVARSLHSNDSHSDTHSHHKSRRHRKNKSPSESRNRIWSSELAKHLQFDLVDTTGMTEDQLREIPYTVVETNSKRTNSNLKIHKSSSKSSVGAKSNGSGNTITNGSGSTTGQGKNRVDRIRGLYYQSTQPHEGNGAKNGSIRSASTISSRECERNSGLVRMMSSMSMGDFISPTGSNLSPMENSALRVSHEHTDSGLGADQDYAYSSERSSDSTRYGTNKSSGASSGSHRKSGGANSGSAYNSLMQQTVSNQQQQHQQQHRQNSFFAQRQQQQQQQNNHHHHQQQQQLQHQQQAKPNYRNSQTNQNQSNTLAPIHNSPHASSSLTAAAAATSAAAATTTIPATGNAANSGNGHSSGSAKASAKASASGSGSGSGSGNRLLNYTTFENNQYKFSLNNAFGKGGGTGGAGGGAGIGVGVGVGGVGGGSTAAGSTGNPMAAATTVCGSGGTGSNLSGSGGGNSGFGLGTNQKQQLARPLDSLVEWTNSPAAPYYYNGPSTSSAHALVKRRDAKSDIGVPTRRLSGQSATKSQLTGGGAGGGGGGGAHGGYGVGAQLANASCYPMHPAAGTGYAGVGGAAHTYMGSGHLAGSGYAGLHPAKSDLFLSYIHSGASMNGSEYERPYIYNYKMPQMPEFLRVPANGSPKQSHQQQLQHQQQQQPQQQTSSAYHISGAQTADLPPLYGGSAPATDVMYYQFDNGSKGAAAPLPPPPICQQPKSLLLAHNNITSEQPHQSHQQHLQQQQPQVIATAAKPSSSLAAAAAGHVVGPLVYLQHGPNIAPTNATSSQQTRTNNNEHACTLLHSASCSEDDLDEQLAGCCEVASSDQLETTNDEDEDEDEDEDADDDEVVDRVVDANDNVHIGAYADEDDEVDNDFLEDEHEAAAAAAEAEDVFDGDVLLLLKSPTDSTNGNGGQQQQQQQQNLCTTSASTSASAIASVTALTPMATPTPTPTATATQRTISVSSLANINLDNCNANARHHLMPNNAKINSTSTSTSTSTSAPASTATSTNANANANPNSETLAAEHRHPVANSSTSNNMTTSTTITTTTTTTNSNMHRIQNSNSNLVQNQNISSSLEIILSPIIQSTRRAQL